MEPCTKCGRALQDGFWCPACDEQACQVILTDIEKQAERKPCNIPKPNRNRQKARKPPWPFPFFSIHIDKIIIKKQ